MKKLFIIFFCIPILALSQAEECGTIATQQQVDYLTQTRILRQSWSKPEFSISVPVQHHIVRESNGTGGLDPFDLPQIMNTLNTYYSNSNLVFYECAPVNFIDNSSYYDFNQSQESAIRAVNDVPNVINIYYFKLFHLNF